MQRISSYRDHLPSKGPELTTNSKALEKLCRDYALLREIAGSGSRESNVAADKLLIIADKCTNFTRLSVEDTSDLSTLHYFSLHSLFTGLLELKLFMCPPTTVLDLYSLRLKLEILDIENSGIPDVAKVLAPIDEQQLKKFKPMIMSRSTILVPEDFQWVQLKQLRLRNCGIARLDQAFHLMPLVEYIDVSHNVISHLIHLQDCVNLRRLVISHNRIRVLSNIGRVLGNLTHLDLSHNCIQSLDGIDKVFGLQRVDLSFNTIDDFREMRYLSKLPCLENLSLLGNPIANHPQYRLLTYRQLLVDGSVMSSSREVPVLDAVEMTRMESKRLRSSMFRAMEDQQRDRPHLVLPNGTDEFDYSGHPDFLQSSLFDLSLDEDFIDDDHDDSGGLNSKELAGEVSGDRAALDPRSFERAKRDSTIANNRDEYNSVSENDIGHSSKHRVNRSSISSNYFNRLSRVSGSGLNANPLLSNQILLMLILQRGLWKQRLGSRMSASSLHLSQRIAVVSEELSAESRHSMVPPDLEQIRSSRSHIRAVKKAEKEAKERAEKEAKEKAEKEAKEKAEREQAEKDKAREAEREQMRSSLIKERAGVGRAVSRIKLGEDGGCIEEDVRNGSDVKAENEHLCGSEQDIQTLLGVADLSGNGQDSAARGSIRTRLESSDDEQDRYDESTHDEPHSRSGVGSGAAPDSPKKEKRGVLRRGVSSFWKMGKSSSTSTLPAASRSSTSVPGTQRGSFDLGYSSGFDSIGINFVVDSSSPADHLFTASQRHAYVGLQEYEDLFVVDNLELYFREQIFSPRRPSGHAAYLTLGPQSLDDLEAEGFTFAGPAYNGDSRFISFVSAPPCPEGFSALFSTKLVDLDCSSLADQSGTSEVGATFSGTAAKPKSRLSMRFKSLTKVDKSSTNTLPTPSDSHGGGQVLERKVIEPRMLLVLTDVCLYLIFLDSIPPQATFKDVPIPSVFRVHPLHHLRNCILYFGLQRSALQFSKNSEQRSSSGFRLLDKEFNGCPLFSKYGLGINIKPTYTYLIVTRDKSKTYPIVTQIPQLANAAKCLENLDREEKGRGGGAQVQMRGQSPPSMSQIDEEVHDTDTEKTFAVREKSDRQPEVVNILNMDAAVTEAVAAVASSKGVDGDIVFYQMLFQCWRKRPGVFIARTIILTPTLLVLGDEDLKSAEVKLNVVDSCFIKDLSRIKIEDNQQFVTLLIKPSKVLATSRKWRLVAESVGCVVKLVEELKRLCAENGVSDVI